MTESDVARRFLQAEIDGLAAFDFVAVGPAGSPLHTLEVTRTEDRALEVRVPGRPSIVPELAPRVRSQLRERGFASEDAADRTRPWVHAARDAAEAVELAYGVLTQVFGEKPDVRLDVVHGSHRAEHEARQKLAELRVRIEKLLTQMLEKPPEQDADGDYALPLGDVQVMVAPRAVPGGPVVVRVFAICNVGVNVVPELGLFLARLNFGLMFGRFALDAEHRAIWFDETLLGEHFGDEELRFALRVVASTADQWDDRLKQMFGGATYQEVLTDRKGEKELPRIKPGTQDGPGEPGRGLYL